MGAIVSAQEAALQLHRALWGREFGRGSDRHHALQSHATANARKQHRKRERPLCINWGLGKPLFSGSRLCPPPCTSTRHVTRERGLVESRRRAALPFVLPRPCRASTCSYPFFLRATVQLLQGLPVFPVCERACSLCSHLWRCLMKTTKVSLKHDTPQPHHTGDPHAPMA